MRIAICDDDKTLLLELRDKIYEYSNVHNWESVIDTFDSGSDLINSKAKYDIIILDYQMDNIDGLETAKQLRTGINRFACIVFLTSYPEIAISAYDVDTYRFVLKNTLYGGLYKALDDFSHIRKIDYDISIKCENEMFTINTENITFIEVQNKYCYIHLVDGNILSTKTTLTNLYKEVPHDHFCKTHKSYIVNLKHIAKTKKDSILVNGYHLDVPISRNYINIFKKAHYSYLKEHQI